MATAPTPAPPTPSVTERVAARFDLSDRRNLVGLGVLFFCAGIMVGARLMRGAVPPVGVGPTLTPAGGAVLRPGGVPGPAVPPIPFDIPCAGCRERAVAEAAKVASTRPPTPVADTDQAERENVTARQAMPPEGMRTFSPYNESEFPAEMVTGGDSSLPPEQQ